MTAERRQGRYSAGTATANYIHRGAEPPEWLVEIVPGAREAREAWQAENAKGEALVREWQKSSRALTEYRALRPLAADLERAERAHADLTRGLAQQAKAALRALEKFDDLVADERERDDFAARAAATALAAQEELVEAWETARAALIRRDAAWLAAGSPGRAWEQYAPNPLDRLPTVERIVRIALDKFDLDATREVADSGATTAPRVATVVLPDGRTITPNPLGPFGPAIVTKPESEAVA